MRFSSSVLSLAIASLATLVQTSPLQSRQIDTPICNVQRLRQVVTIAQSLDALAPLADVNVDQDYVKVATAAVHAAQYTAYQVISYVTSNTSLNVPNYLITWLRGNTSLATQTLLNTVATDAESAAVLSNALDAVNTSLAEVPNVIASCRLYPNTTLTYAPPGSVLTDPPAP